MSFDQLVKDGQPALMAEGIEWEVTEGRSWDLTITVTDQDTDEPIDLTGVTIAAKALSDIDGSTVVTFTTTLGGVGNNEITLTATPTNTATAGGTSKQKRTCPMHLTLTNGAGRKVDVFGVQTSQLIIHQGAS